MVKKQTDKIVYSYSRDTKEYLGEYKCQRDPLIEGSFLIPSNATETPPPETSANEKACYIYESWVVKPDYRGRKAVVLGTQQIQVIKDLGDYPDGSALLTVEDEIKIMSGKQVRLDEDGNLDFYDLPLTTEQQIADLQKELDNTDWYVVRFSETGVEIPAEISARRAEIRETISNLREQGE